MTPAPAGAIAGRVAERLGELLEAERRHWTRVDPALAEPFEVLRHHALDGGKRIRPAFFYWAYVGAGGYANDPGVDRVAAAIELVHASALLHDDVIDGSVARRGAESAHSRLARRHTEQGWAGDPSAHGRAVAILLGNLALAYSGQLMAGSPSAVRELFDLMQVEVNVGQLLDVGGTACGPDPDRAERICRYKTASYTVERPLLIGAALATGERRPALEEPLSAFGRLLGEAFQLRDDLLGVFGDPEVTGKPVGEDLLEGKPTLLAGLAAQRDPEFAGLFGRPATGPEEVARMRAIIERTGARAEVEARLAGLVERSWRALACLPLSADAVAALAELTRFVTGRDR